MWQISRGHQAGQPRAIKVAHHVHVDAGFERLARGNRAGIGHAVGDQFLYRAEIADNQTVEVPLVAQDFREGERIGRRRHAVERVERAHHRRRARVDRRVIRRQVDLAQGQFGHVDSIVFAPRVRSAIGREMFYAGRDRISLAEIVALIALNISGCNGRA